MIPQATALEEGLRRYDRAASKTARLVLRDYSTSFGWAARLLARPMRPHIANLYGLVRLADEIVDGPAEAAGLTTAQRRELLDELEAEVRRARRLGYSANLIVHAFNRTAARFGIGDELTAPFFDSMRADLTLTTCTRDEFERYVYGSAEVIGLMCLRVFLGGDGQGRGERRRRGERRERLEHREHLEGCEHRERVARLERGARRLGSAFQQINFLRDLGDDVRTLGRSYFPSVPDGVLTEARKAQITAAIRDDLAVAEASLRELPRGARPAVLSALRLFAELTDRIESVPASQVIERRIRVPDAVKARIIARASIEARWS